MAEFCDFSTFEGDAFHVDVDLIESSGDELEPMSSILDSVDKKPVIVVDITDTDIHTSCKQESEGISFNTENIDDDSENINSDNHLTLLNILLQNPEELDLKHKPSGIRENKMFTLDARSVSVKSGKADDNGSYISKGRPKQTYWYGEDGACTVHKNENGVRYVNESCGSSYKRKDVPEIEVYELSRQYHQSKHNPTFTRTIITVRRITKKLINPYYMVIYKWSGPKKTFEMPCHGNGSKPQASEYYRKDPSLFFEVDKQLASGLSADQVYNNLSKVERKTVRCKIKHSPKMVDHNKSNVLIIQT